MPRVPICRGRSCLACTGGCVCLLCERVRRLQRGRSRRKKKKIYQWRREGEYQGTEQRVHVSECLCVCVGACTPRRGAPSLLPTEQRGEGHWEQSCQVFCCLCLAPLLFFPLSPSFPLFLPSFFIAFHFPYPRGMGRGGGGGGSASLSRWHRQPRGRSGPSREGGERVSRGSAPCRGLTFRSHRLCGGPRRSPPPPPGGNGTPVKE